MFGCIFNGIDMYTGTTTGLFHDWKMSGPYYNDYADHRVGSPITEVSWMSALTRNFNYHSLHVAPAVTVWVCGAGSDVATSYQGLFENAVRTYGQPGAENPPAMSSLTLLLHTNYL